MNRPATYSSARRLSPVSNMACAFGVESGNRTRVCGFAGRRLTTRPSQLMLPVCYVLNRLVPARPARLAFVILVRCGTGPARRYYRRGEMPAARRRRVNLRST